MKLFDYVIGNPPYQEETASDQLFEEHPEIEQLSGAGTGAKIVSSIMTMYGGPVIDVTLQFDDSLLGLVQDKFGEDVSAVRTGPDKLVSSVQVQESPVFWGWLFQFGERMRILSPESMVKECREKARELEDCEYAD